MNKEGGRNKRKNKKSKVSSSTIWNISGLLQAIPLYIPNYKQKTFQVVPYNSQFNNALGKLFNGIGDRVTVIFPKWEKEYKKSTSLDLQVNGKDMVDFTKEQLNKSEWIVLYIPINYNLYKLFRTLYSVIQYKIYKQGKLIIIFLQSNIFIKNKLPQFSLEDASGKQLKNIDYELTEQILLNKYVSDKDSVLQLGGNIGTSCILVDKIRNGGNNICVEPNESLIPLLKRNKKNTNSRFVIIDGILSNQSGMVLIESDDLNKYGSYIESSTKKNTIPGKIVKNYDFTKLNKKYNFTVLLVDCEGCFESFLDEYQNALDNINIIIIELDNPDMCNYDKVINKLQLSGFLYMEGEFHRVYVHSRTLAGN